MPFSHFNDLLVSKNQLLAVAFSGGLDSTVLLHQLHCWKQFHPKINLRALHVHHNLNKNANTWMKHCLTLSKKWNIHCNILKIKINDKFKQGTEASARDARYNALEKALMPDEHLLTGHHLDDQSETFLLALKRGSGPKGLSGISKIKLLKKHKLFRPLLNFSKQELKNYAEKWKLSWIEDDSNKNIRYDRNFIRINLMPKLLQRWPHFSKAVTRSALLCAEQEELLNELLTKDLTELIKPNKSIYFKPLLKMKETHTNALLRRWIALLGEKMPSQDRLKRIKTEIMLSKKEANPRLKIGQYEIRRYKEHIYLTIPKTPFTPTILNWKDISKPLILPDKIGILKATKKEQILRFPEKYEDITIRFQKSNSHNTIESKFKSKIKKIWKKHNIPPWEQNRTPLIYYNEKLICAPGFFTIREEMAKKTGWNIHWDKITNK